MLEAKRLSKFLQLSESQTLMLIALQRVHVMSYAICEELGLYARDRAKRRIIDPLEKAGWITVHRLPAPEHEPGKRYRVIWHVKEERRQMLVEMIKVIRLELERDWAKAAEAGDDNALKLQEYCLEPVDT